MTQRIRRLTLIAALAGAAALLLAGAGGGTGPDHAAAQDRARFLPYGASLRLVVEPAGGPRRTWAGWDEASGALRWIARNGLDGDAQAVIAWRGDLWTGPGPVTAVARNLVRRFLERPRLESGRAAASAPETAVLGGTVLVYATGFAPPNEFCSAVRVQVDGSAVDARRLADSQGDWALRFGLSGSPGLRTIELRQPCTGGPSGTRTSVIRARAFVRATR